MSSSDCTNSTQSTNSAQSTNSTQSSNSTQSGQAAFGSPSSGSTANSPANLPSPGNNVGETAGVTNAESPANVLGETVTQGAQAPQATQGTSALPRTGSDVNGLGVAAVVLLAAGASILLYVRRRHVALTD